MKEINSLDLVLAIVLLPIAIPVAVLCIPVLFVWGLYKAVSSPEW